MSGSSRKGKVDGFGVDVADGWLQVKLAAMSTVLAFDDAARLVPQLHEIYGNANDRRVVGTSKCVFKCCNIEVIVLSIFRKPHQII